MIDTVDRWPQSSDLQALEDALIGMGKTVRGKECQCPWHDDRSPSASIVCGDDGKYRVYCHRCDIRGDIYDITHAQPSQDSQRRGGNGHSRPSEPHALPKTAPRVYDSMASLEAAFSGNEGFYQYRNPTTGDVDMIIVRYRKPDGRKCFAQHRPLPGGRWEAKCPDGPLPLFNRKGIAERTGPVVVVEGEKCVIALYQVGLVGTTSSGGAGKAGKTDWSPLAGRTVYLWPDNDPPDEKTGKSTGIEHMREVQDILGKLEPRPDVRWIDPATTGLGPKGDVADLLAANATLDMATRRAAVEAVLATAKGSSVIQELLDDNQDIVDGKTDSTPFPWPLLTSMTEAIVPGNVVIVYGGPGSGKSFFLMQCLLFWFQQNIPAACYMLENNKRTHIRRAIAQMEGCPTFTSKIWLKENKETADIITRKWAQFINGFEHCITARIKNTSAETVTCADLLSWAEEQAQRGRRIIAIDPISIAESSDKPWNDSKMLMNGLQRIATQYQCALLCVHHPTKGSSKVKPGEAVMSGGAALGNYSHVVLHISKDTDSGDDLRYIYIQKAREGEGQGMTIQYQFSRRDLTFIEQGPVTKNKKPPAMPRPGIAQRSMTTNPHPSEDLFGKDPHA